jgi:hypothetical protein
MYASVVMQKAGHTFGYCEASSQVVWNDIFERESGVVLSNFIEWSQLEEPSYLTIPADVDKEPPQFNRIRSG